MKPGGCGQFVADVGAVNLHCVYKIIIKIIRNLQWLKRETNSGGGWAVNAEERARGAGSVAVPWGGWCVVYGGEAMFGMPAFAVLPWAEICPFA